MDSPPESDTLEQAPSSASSVPRIARPAMLRRARSTPGGKPKDATMWVILLEALFALLVLAGIVWWTMFAGRRKGEPRRRDGER